jgi:hypothetical protein
MKNFTLKHSSWASLFIAFVLCVALLSYADNLSENLNTAFRDPACEEALEGSLPLLTKEFERSASLDQVIVSMMTSSVEGHVSVPYFAASVLAMALVLF